MSSFLRLCLISAFLFVSYAQETAPREGDPLFVFCDFRLLGGCFTEFKDPITCSGLNTNKNALVEATPTNRFTTPGNANKLIFFIITNKFEMPADVLSIEDVGLETPSVSRSSSYPSFEPRGRKKLPFSSTPRRYKYPSSKVHRNVCFVRRDQLKAKITTVTRPSGEKVTTLRTKPFGARCRPR